MAADMERCAGGCGGGVVRWHRCQDHYQQLILVTELVARLSEEERFWTKVDREGPIPPEMPGRGPCWLWTDIPDTNGYGRFAGRGANPPAHRYAYELLVGPIPEGLELDHLCRVRHCVRPEHLEPVTHGENMRRSWKHRTLKTHCKYGHLLGPANVYGSGSVRYCRKCAVRRKKEHLARKAREPNTAA